MVSPVCTAVFKKQKKTLRRVCGTTGRGRLGGWVDGERCQIRTDHIVHVADGILLLTTTRRSDGGDDIVQHLELGQTQLHIFCF